MGKFFKLIWAWFNGNKTVIGGAIMANIVFLSQEDVAVISPESLLYRILVFISGILTGTGIFHKILKGVNNT